MPLSDSHAMLTRNAEYSPFFNPRQTAMFRFTYQKDSMFINAHLATLCVKGDAETPLSRCQNWAMTARVAQDTASLLLDAAYDL
jgi:hypothetical protein